MSSAPGLRAPSVDKSLYFSPRPPQLPYSLSMREAEITTAASTGAGGTAHDRLRLPGAHATPFNPLLAHSPRAAGARVDPRRRFVVTTFLRVVVAESNQRRPEARQCSSG